MNDQNHIDTDADVEVYILKNELAGARRSRGIWKSRYEKLAEGYGQKNHVLALADEKINNLKVQNAELRDDANERAKELRSAQAEVEMLTAVLHSFYEAYTAQAEGLDYSDFCAAEEWLIEQGLISNDGRNDSAIEPLVRAGDVPF